MKAVFSNYGMVAFRDQDNIVMLWSNDLIKAAVFSIDLLNGVCFFFLKLLKVSFLLYGFEQYPFF